MWTEITVRFHASVAMAIKTFRLGRFRGQNRFYIETPRPEIQHNVPLTRSPPSVINHKNAYAVYGSIGFGTRTWIVWPCSVVVRLYIRVTTVETGSRYRQSHISPQIFFLKTREKIIRGDDLSWLCMSLNRCRERIFLVSSPLSRFVHHVPKRLVNNDYRER